MIWGVRFPTHTGNRSLQQKALVNQGTEVAEPHQPLCNSRPYWKSLSPALLKQQPSRPGPAE